MYKITLCNSQNNYIYMSDHGVWNISGCECASICPNVFYDSVTQYIHLTFSAFVANKSHRDSCPQKAHAIDLPMWANQSVYEKLGHLTAEHYRLQAFTPEMRRLRAGEV